MGAMDWLIDPVVDYGTKAFDTVGAGLGTAWDWGTQNQAAMGAVAGVAGGVLNYMSAKNAPAPGEEQREWQEGRTRDHNRGITEAAKSYQNTPRRASMLRGR